MLKKNYLLIFFLLIPLSLFSKKSHTIGIYISGNNDLASYAPRSIRQACSVDESENVNVVILHAKRRKRKNSSKKEHLQYEEQYCIGKQYAEIFVITNKEKKLLYTVDGPEADSSNEQLLIDFYTYIEKHFPADNYHLFFWDHGTGPLEPLLRKKILAESLFKMGHLKEIEERQYLNFLTIFLSNNRSRKGLCYDQKSNRCLTDQTLSRALLHLTENVIKKKFSIIGFDMCFMAMIETIVTIKDFADIMVASQEAELGEGWDYSSILKIFNEIDPTPKELAEHIVKEHEKTFSYISYYTLSAVNLSSFTITLEQIKELTKIIYYGLKNQYNNSFSNVLELCRSKRKCTHFDESDFIDILDFFRNLLEQLPSVALQDQEKEELFCKELSDQLKKVMANIENNIIINKSGKKFKRASGLSIYFPAHHIHGSYYNNNFATQTYWLEILKIYHQCLN